MYKASRSHEAFIDNKIFRHLSLSRLFVIKILEDLRILRIVAYDVSRLIGILIHALVISFKPLFLKNTYKFRIDPCICPN